MDLSLERRRRLLELVGEAREILGGCLEQDGRPKTFAELEDECIEVGDLFTVELLRERIAERKPDAIGRYCPFCGCEGEQNPDEPHVLQTDRGDVGWLEPACYCRSCRRSFFPSFGRIGTCRRRDGQSAGVGQDGIRGDRGDLV